MEETPKRK